MIDRELEKIIHSKISMALLLKTIEFTKNQVVKILIAPTV